MENVVKLIDGKLEIEEDDMYDLDCVLGDIIISALTKFKEHKNSIPNAFFTSGQNHSREEIELANIEWDRAIDKMIASFDSSDPYQIAHERLKEYDPVDHDLTHIVTDPTSENFKQLQVVYRDGFSHNDTHRYNRKVTRLKTKIEKERIEGRMLFATHFESFWV